MLRSLIAILKGRSGKWPAVEQKAFERDGHACRWCGKTSKDVKLVGHHILPFHLFPHLELDLNNVITLCQPIGGGDHLHRGHTTASGKCGWECYNPDIVAEAAVTRLRSK